MEKGDIKDCPVMLYKLLSLKAISGKNKETRKRGREISDNCLSRRSESERIGTHLTDTDRLCEIKLQNGNLRDWGSHDQHGSVT